MIEHWFSARLLFEAEVNGGVPRDGLQEESFRLIRANDGAAAEACAREVGEREEHSYANAEGQTVRWRFIRVVEVQEISDSELQHGTEVFSIVSRMTGSE